MHAKKKMFKDASNASGGIITGFAGANGELSIVQLSDGSKKIVPREPNHTIGRPYMHIKTGDGRTSVPF